MIGKTLGHYKILEPLGAGGMGEVYRAEDSRLGRKVAVKVLPPEFASDPERLACFEQEARAAAALNHPHIAVVHDVGAETADDGAEIHFIVQEYLDGASLRELLTKGALPLEKALGLAGEVAEALVAAHGAGIVHRDLKPDNILVTSEGHAKVLDFGLAKLTEIAGPGGAELSMSPTMLGTVAGQVMGTAGYMAPEQASGSTEIDHRADVFAFGCVLYEMVAGRQPFAGRSVAETLSQIQHEDAAPLAEVDASLPAELQRIIHKSLAKEADERYQTAKDLRVDLRSLLSGVESGQSQPSVVSATLAAPPKSGVRLAAAAGLAVGLVLATAAGAVFWSGLGSQTPVVQESTFSIALSEDLGAAAFVDYFPNQIVAISRDGTRIVFAARSAGMPGLYVRDLNSLELRAIPDTEGAHAPFFSHDGRSIGFFTLPSHLKKVSLSGDDAAAFVITDDVRNADTTFGTWGDDDQIIFSNFDSGLFSISAAGGAPAPLTTPDDEAHLSPQVLPGARAVLYHAARSGAPDIEVLPLVEADPEPVLLVEDASDPMYLESGHLLYMQGNRLHARAFDAVALSFPGPPFSVPLNVAVDSRGAYDPTPRLAVSRHGTLVFEPGTTSEAQTELVWVDREGNEEPFDTLAVRDPRIQLSPDDKRLVLEYREGRDVVTRIYDMERRSLGATLMTKRQVYPSAVVWTPDGLGIIVARTGPTSSSFHRIAADGSDAEEELFTVPGSWAGPMSFSQDGTKLTYNYFRRNTTGDLGVFEFSDDGSRGSASDFVETPRLESQPQLSPDGRAIAYVDGSGGNATAENEVWVKPYPDGEPQRVGVGTAPLWSPDGKELFYLNTGRDETEVKVTTVETDPQLILGRESRLFTGPLYRTGGDSGYAYDLSADGQRFLFIKSAPDDRRVKEFVVVQNWFEKLRQWEAAAR